MKHATLEGSNDTVLIVEPDQAGDAARLGEWLQEQSGWVLDRLHQHGALLLRGFPVDSAAGFQALCARVNDTPLAYVGGESPRTAVSGNVYTSTEYPAKLEISLHNEMSYAASWPRHLFFCCLVPPESGGQTPLADSRRILRDLAPEVRERFVERQVTYFSNYHDGWGLGKSWQQTFETDDQAIVERHCDANGIACEWVDGNLRTRHTRPATAVHPVTGDEVWFNQADRWHVTSRGERQAEAMLRTLGEEGLPRHARFGDGSDITTEDLAAVHDAFRRNEILFDWQPGDVLVLDNLLVAHGRKPFAGERRIVVTMGG
ncbi:MAG: TauD/TfdA family dioxygenase [Pseudomonadota bacterium]